MRAYRELCPSAVDGERGTRRQGEYARAREVSVTSRRGAGGGGQLDISGLVAIVTGAARGLGRAEAVELAARGAKVVVCDVESPSATAETIIQAGGEAVPVMLDLGKPASADALFEFALATYGDIHVLVNNAGIVRDAMSFNLSLEDWSAVLAVNLTAPFALSRLCARYWRSAFKAGCRTDRVIVNTSSESGLYGNAGQSNYAAAKAGLAALTLTLASELEPYGVRVNAIAPRARTEMSARAFGELAHDGHFDPYAPAHVAAIVAWLASGAAEGVTGQVFVVHGSGIELLEGWRIQNRVERNAPWRDAELLELRELLFDGIEPRRIAPPISDLFVIRRNEGSS
jgi:NAD(P)-dependent dehydrogenase (short-subunit alcohol dehydrogenase family)